MEASGVQAFDSVLKGRVGREKSAEEGALHSIGKEEVTDLFSNRRLDRGSLRPTANTPQCVGEPLRVTRKLYRRRIRKELTLAGNGLFDQATKEEPHIPDELEGEAQCDGDPCAAAVAVASDANVRPTL